MLEIKIKYFCKDLPKIEQTEIGDWIDLYAAETIAFNEGEFKLIPLGVGMILPDGYEAHLAPRSSTFKKKKILQTNSVGVIDNAYSGEEDQWLLPALAKEPTTINKGEKIAQFRIVQKMPAITITEVEHLNEKSRGGFGSTGGYKESK